MRNSKILLQGVSLLLLMALISSGCNVGLIDLSATQTAVAGTALAQKATQTALEQAQTAVAATQTAMSFTATPTATTQAEPTATPTRTDTPTPSPTLPPSVATLVVESETVALITDHGRYVTAMDDSGNWLLRQEPNLSNCGWFALQHLDSDKVALVTCHNRYVTASKEGNTDLDWALRQETDLSPCGQFTLHDLGHGGFAFETCAHRYFTALDGNRSPELQWVVIARTEGLSYWERFRLEQLLAAYTSYTRTPRC